MTRSMKSQTCDIYLRSSITIVAANADDASKGFLRHLPPSNKTFTVPWRFITAEYGTVSLQFPSIHTERDVEPIQKRAWTLQEQMLAQRVLYFGSHTLEWRCGAGKKNLEPNSIDLAPALGQLWKSEDRLLRTMLKPLPQGAWNVLKLWMHTVANYSPRTCTLDSDRLQALAGIATIFSSELGPKYYAGLWYYYLEEQLEWHRRRGTQVAKSSSYCAPSWSWASSRGTFEAALRCYYGKTMLTVLQAECTLSSPELPYGPVTEGLITVSGRHASGELLRERDTDRWTIVLNEGDDARVSDAPSVERPVKPPDFDFVEVIFDTSDDVRPQHVLCLRTNDVDVGLARGLVLEAVAQPKNTFRRIGFFYQNRYRDDRLSGFWRDTELTII